MITDANWLRRCVDFRRVWRTIMTEWAQHLTATDLSVVWCVFERTIAVSVPASNISQADFIKGSGVTSRATIWRSIAKLKKINMLLVSKVERVLTYALNINWKKLTMSMNKPSPPSKTRLLLSKKLIDRKVEELEDRSIEDIRKLVKTTQKKSASTRATKIAKAGGRLNMAQVASLWGRSVREAFGPKAPAALKQKEIYALLGWQKRRDSDDFSELLEWVLLNWQQVMASQFHWMPIPPKLPRADFAVKFSVNMEEAFATKDDIAVVAEAKTKDVGKSVSMHRRRLEEDKARLEEWKELRTRKSSGGSYDDWV